MQTEKKNLTTVAEEVHLWNGLSSSVFGSVCFFGAASFCLVQTRKWKYNVAYYLRSRTSGGTLFMSWRGSAFSQIILVNMHTSTYM